AQFLYLTEIILTENFCSCRLPLTLPTFQYQHGIYLAPRLKNAGHGSDNEFRANKPRVFSVSSPGVARQPRIQPPDTVPLDGVEIFSYWVKSVFPSDHIHRVNGRQLCGASIPAFLEKRLHDYIVVVFDLARREIRSPIKRVHEHGLIGKLVIAE